MEEEKQEETPVPSSGLVPRRKKTKTSQVHQFFDDFSAGFYQCKDCSQLLSKQENGCTSNLIKHLKTHHKDNFAVFEASTIRKRKLSAVAIQEPFGRELFLKKLTKLIVDTNQPYSLVEKDSFRDFVNFISKDSLTTQLPGRSLMTTSTENSYKEMKMKVIQLLSAAESKVNLVMDVWTSSNKIAFLGIICRFVTKGWELRTLPIDLIQLSGTHSGENLAHAVLPVITEFKLEDKLISITTDNAANMNTFFNHLAIGLRERGIIFDVKNQRVRCLAHILNLCAKAFLKSADESIPVTKLHRAIADIGRTPQRKELYFRQCGERKLLPGLDFEVRWNSTFDMIESALDMRTAIDSTCTNEVDPALAKNRLTEDDWSQLQKLKEILAPLKKATLRLSEQKQPCIAEATTTYQELFEQFDKYLTTYDSDSDLDVKWIFDGVSAAKEKLLDYYTESGGMVYCNGIVLHPSYKLDWFKKKNWPAAWIHEYKRLITNEWEARYKDNFPGIEAYSEELNSEELRHLELMGSGSSLDELGRYLKEPIVPLHQVNKLGLLNWWKSKEHDFPRLSKMGKDYLSVAGSSVPVESFFSSGTDILTDNRQRLTPDHVKQLMCLRMWNKISFLE